MHEDIRRYLSEPRFQRYLADCDGDPDKALRLYEANIRLAGTAMEAINIIEVALRNSMDQQLRKWNLDRIGNESWTTLPAAHLANILNQGDNLREAERRAKKAIGQKRTPTHDDLLAQLSFGTWFFLMPSSKSDSKKVVWDSVLKDAFPMRHNVTPDKIKKSIEIIYDLRNRVAHFEPIYALYLEGKRSAMVNLLHMINRPMKRWFIETERFSAEIQNFRVAWPELTPSKEFND